MAKQNAPYPDHMVAAMLKNSVYYHEHLRRAAQQRGMPHYTSVTPIEDVIAYLRSQTKEV